MAGGFTQIQNSFLDDKKLSPEARLIGVFYARFANREGWAYPGIKLLMRLSGYGRDKVKRARRELVKGGYMEMRRRPRQQGHFGRVEYRVTEKIRPLPFGKKPTVPKSV
jgi:hypothetical protein